MVLEMLTGGGLILVGWVVGRFAPARRRPSKPIKPVCGCGHELAYHDPATGECHGLKAVDKHNRYGDWIGKEQVRCTCRQYTGPTPLPTVYAPEVAS
ncbi:hypothetical protein [Streptosporangium sp. CA-115845]|uniref:hypothetical protein n=1 Tax=Streptosporangium sp. CA-115845 TaxID=3240071 RepID=UPI003D90D444